MSETEATENTELDVKLVDHFGEVDTKLGKRKVKLPQKVVMVNGVWAGYVGLEPGSHISIILKGILPADLAEIKAKVDAERQSISSKITVAKFVTEPVTADAVTAERNSLTELGL